MFDLSDVIDKIEYSIDGKEEVYYLEDQQDLDGTKLSMYLLPSVRLIDYIITVDDEEVSIEEINVTLRYDVTFNFSKLDVVTGECEYTYDVEFDYVFIDSMSDHEYLEELAEIQIAQDVRLGRNIEIGEMTLKPVLRTLQ